MTDSTFAHDYVQVPMAPRIPGLAFRRFRGPVDYPAMVAVIAGSKVADGIESVSSADEVDRHYRHLTNSDPQQDMLFVEMEGKVIGYSRVWWDQGLPDPPGSFEQADCDEGAEESTIATGARGAGPAEGPLLFEHFCNLLPEWRGSGIRRAMLDHNERRLREIAQSLESPLQASKRFFQAYVNDGQSHWELILLAAGYHAERYGFEMVRPDLENIPDLPLPDGLEVRPVQTAQVQAVWEAAREAFRDEPGQVEWPDEWLAEWQEDPTFNPGLWQVAWDGDQVAGMVQTYIDEAQNRECNRRRGWSEGICVRRPWRRRGLARALIARSLRALKEQGMDHSALGVDAHNPNGALQLYTSMGFQVVKRNTMYRKAMD